MSDTFTVSVVTLTKNRSVYLQRCLDSLVGQFGRGDELIIIDNDSKDDTQIIISNYTKILPIKIYKTTLYGYPRLYNFAISKCTKQIVVFLDDDCIATAGFIQNIKRAHRTHHLSSVIQGLTTSIPKGNVYAEIMGDHYRNWLKTNTIKHNDLAVFDNKNASLPRQLLVKHGGFSENLTLGSEDIELGIRLRRVGVKIILNKNILAYHHERTTFKGFIQQHIRIAQSEARVDAMVHNDEKIAPTRLRKWTLHIYSMIKRESEYMAKGRFIDMLILPFVYVVLVLTHYISRLKINEVH